MSRGAPSDPAASLSPEVEVFRNRLHATARAALEAGRAQSRWFDIGGDTVCVRLSGPFLESTLTKALAHLEIGPTPRADLTVSAWDDTGAPLPPPPWSAGEGFGPRGEIRGARGGAFRAAFDRGTGALSALDLDRREAFYRVPDAGRVTVSDRAEPFRTILHWWADAHRNQLVHAAAVGRPDGAVLLAGSGGAGKSTVALACLGSPLRYLADDYCLVRPDPEPQVFSLYATAKVDAGTIWRLPHLIPALIEGDGPAQKQIVDVGAFGPGCMLRNSPVRAIVVPSITGRSGSAVRPATGGEGLLAAAPSTMFQLPGRAPETLGRLAALVRRVPAFVLELGDDLADVVACLEACLGPARVTTRQG